MPKLFPEKLNPAHDAIVRRILAALPHAGVGKTPARKPRRRTARNGRAQAKALQGRAIP